MTWSAIHIFEDQSVLARVRDDISQIGTLDAITLLDSSPMLNSIFAESLRLHGTMYSMYTTDADTSLGKWRFPKGKIALFNSGLCHMDETVWSTRDGQYPLSGFWADRFLVHPDDPRSGPLNAEMRSINRINTGKDVDREFPSGKSKPFFSLEGLEGSWIPFGGE